MHACLGHGDAELSCVGRHAARWRADISITYGSSRGDDLDTRLLRANVVKGILEEITTANVNMVNADLLSDQRGLRITETTRRSEGPEILSDLTVSIEASDCKFTSAKAADGKIVVSVRCPTSSTLCRNVAPQCFARCVQHPPLYMALNAWSHAHGHACAARRAAQLCCCVCLC